MTINVSEIPQIDGDLDAVDSAGSDLKTAGTKFAQAGADVNTTWQGLSAVYSAPESGDLLRATRPVETDASSIGTDVGTVGSALIAYAAEVRPIKDQLAQLKLDAGSFNADISGDDDWRKDGDKVDEQHRILKAVNAAVAAWQAAERTCANAINGTYGGTQYHADDGQGQPSADEYGYDAALLDGATASDQGVPWGKAAERDKPWYEDAYDGVVSFGKGLFVDGLWGAVRSLGTLVGVDGADAAGQAWVGVGKLALALSPVAIVLDATVGVPGMKRGELRDTLKNTGKALIAYDMWGQDPARAAGAVTGNIIGAVIGTKGAGMAVKSAGAAVKAVELGGKAAQLVGRGLEGIGSTMVKVSDLKISLQNNISKGLLTRLDNIVQKPLLAGAGRAGRHQFDVIPGRPGGASTLARIGDDVPSNRVGSGHGAGDTAPGRGSGGGGSPTRVGDDTPSSRGNGSSAHPGTDTPSGRTGSGHGAGDTAPARGSGGGGSPTRVGDDAPSSRGNGSSAHPGTDTPSGRTGPGDPRVSDHGPGTHDGPDVDGDRPGADGLGHGQEGPAPAAPAHPDVPTADDATRRAPRTDPAVVKEVAEVRETVAPRLRDLANEAWGSANDKTLPRYQDWVARHPGRTPGSGVIGSWAHKDLSDLVGERLVPEDSGYRLRSEVSFDGGGRERATGTPGTVRPDLVLERESVVTSPRGVETRTWQIAHVWDYKTGGAQIAKSWAQKVADRTGITVADVERLGVG